MQFSVVQGPTAAEKQSIWITSFACSQTLAERTHTHTQWESVCAIGTEVCLRCASFRFIKRRIQWFGSQASDPVPLHSSFSPFVVRFGLALLNDRFRRMQNANLICKFNFFFSNFIPFKLVSVARHNDFVRNRVKFETISIEFLAIFCPLCVFVSSLNFFVWLACAAPPSAAYSTTF